MPKFFSTKHLNNRVFSSGSGRKPPSFGGKSPQEIPVFQKDLEVLYQKTKSELRQKLVEVKYSKETSQKIYNPRAAEEKAVLYKDVEDRQAFVSYLEKERRKFK